MVLVHFTVLVHIDGELLVAASRGTTHTNNPYLSRL